MRLAVRVPVLSTQRTVVAPSASIACGCRVSTCVRARRQAPSASMTLQTTANSSGTIDIASVSPTSRPAVQDPWRQANRLAASRQVKTATKATRADQARQLLVQPARTRLDRCEDATDPADRRAFAGRDDLGDAVALHDERSGAQHACRIGSGARILRDRNRFAGQQRFVDAERLRLDQARVAGEAIAFLDDQAIALDQLLARDARRPRRRGRRCCAGSPARAALPARAPSAAPGRPISRRRRRSRRRAPTASSVLPRKAYSSEQVKRSNTIGWPATERNADANVCPRRRGQPVRPVAQEPGVRLARRSGRSRASSQGTPTAGQVAAVRRRAAAQTMACAASRAVERLGHARAVVRARRRRPRKRRRRARARSDPLAQERHARRGSAGSRTVRGRRSPPGPRIARVRRWRRKAASTIVGQPATERRSGDREQARIGSARRSRRRRSRREPVKARAATPNRRLRSTSERTRIAPTASASAFETKVLPDPGSPQRDRQPRLGALGDFRRRAADSRIAAACAVDARVAPQRERLPAPEPAPG